VSQVWKEGLDAERDAYRHSLIDLGFTDDGKILRGPVPWRHGDREHTATIDVEITERFPFSPPRVRVVDAGAALEPTFHLEREDGALCLWTSDIPVETAPWHHAKELILKTAGWLAQTAAGWPDDDDRDLERYLETDGERMLVYDADRLEGRTGYFQTTGTLGNPAARVVDPLPWGKPNIRKMRSKGPRRREKHLTWFYDVGAVTKPIQSWEDLVSVIGDETSTLQELISADSVQFILLRYRRGDSEPATLALTTRLERTGTIRIYACESADTSITTRTLRAGVSDHGIGEKKVAVVGCGAVGSHVANLLFRAGVCHITLIDPEKLRPGNVIRHFADDRFVGMSKPLAVHGMLHTLGLDTSGIKSFSARVDSPEQAIEVISKHDLVIDATANARATALLVWASEQLDRPMVTTCVQREGGLARVDRFPIFPADETTTAESHLASTPVLGGGISRYEQGCGSPVSTTPPLAAVAAATLCARVALDELKMAQSLPATLVEVLAPQPDQPYDRIGIVTSRLTDRAEADV